MTKNSESSSDSIPEPATPETATLTPDAKSTESSPEQTAPDAKPESLLDAVKSVVEESKEKSDPSPDKEDTTVQNSDEPKADADKDDSTEPKPEDDRLDKNPRFREVIAERNQLRESVQDYERIQSFMSSNQLSVEDVKTGFQIMAAIRNNPVEGLKLLSPHMENLQRFAGHQLPPDLQERVESGFIDAESARELALRRNQEAFQNHRQQEATESQAQAQERQQRETQQRTQADMGQAVTKWEEGIQARDVDYPAKAKLVETQYRVLMQQTPPRTPQEAVALADKAYAEVQEHTKAFRAQKPQIRGPRSTISSPSAKAVPATLQEAIALARRR